jgi:hypothetical protein
MKHIHIQPPEIEDRFIASHWEGDLINNGAGNRSSVGMPWSNERSALSY